MCCELQPLFFPALHSDKWMEFIIIGIFLAERYKNYNKTRLLNISFSKCFSGRSRGGRGGDYDRRDRYSSGRRDFGGFRDRDNGRGYDGGSKAFGTNSQNGYGGSNGSSNGFSGSSYNGNGQSNFNNQTGAFTGQNNFQAQQFVPGKNGTQTSAGHPSFPFPQAQAPQQHPPPLVPYPMPPQFSQ